MLADKTVDLLGLLLRVFAQIRATWALIGGAALPLRGRVRGTRDLDLLVLSQDPDRIVHSLREAGFAHHERADRHKLDRVVLLRFWYPISESASLGVDVQIARDPFLDKVLARATDVSVGRFSVPVASAEDLILLKMLSFRPIDRADAIELTALASGLDTDYLTATSIELSLADRWSEVSRAAEDLKKMMEL